jgi:(S)-3,5-dihydroxyphenylglycine transaminase
VTATIPDTELDLGSLHAALADPTLESMTFLNEVAERYPDAVSFAAGRPCEEFFDTEDLHRYLRTFCRYLTDELGYPDDRVTRTLCQYGDTKGILGDLIAKHLKIDESIDADPAAIVVTVGCQEAMALVLRALRRDERDVILAVSPTYVGLTGAARLFDLPVIAVRSGHDGVDLTDLIAQIHQARASGLRPRACYLVPDFANPTGARLDLAARRRLLDIARAEDILLLEDNPYGLFRAEYDALPTLKALDTGRRVVHLGSFAKTVLPGARIGYVLADQRVRTPKGRGESGLFADELTKIKSMLTVNTPPVAQAVAGGKLLTHGCSLLRGNDRERRVYRTNLACLLDGLAERFGDDPAVTWNTPTGGFFISVTVPFDADDTALEASGARHGVIWTPMRHFYDGAGGERQLRLSVSALDPARIDTGLDRLAGFINHWRKEASS